MPLSEPAPSRKLLSDGPSGMAQPRGRGLPLRLLLAGALFPHAPRAAPPCELESWLNLQWHGVGSAALSSDARNWAVLLPHRWMLPRICSVASGASRSGSAARPAAGVFDPASRQWIPRAIGIGTWAVDAPRNGPTALGALRLIGEAPGAGVAGRRKNLSTVRPPGRLFGLLG